MKHEDNRRILTEFGNGKNWKVCKVIEIINDCLLGNHYHKEKDESFMLVKGNGYIYIDNKEFKMELFKEYFVKRGEMHEFSLDKGSILIGLCSEEFNLKDDFK